jgi:hypothetical protein
MFAHPWLQEEKKEERMPPRELACLEEMFDAAQEGKDILCHAFHEFEALSTPEPHKGILKHHHVPAHSPIGTHTWVPPREFLTGALSQWQEGSPGPFAGSHVQTAEIWIYRIMQSEMPPDATIALINLYDGGSIHLISGPRTIRSDWAGCVDRPGWQSTFTGFDQFGWPFWEWSIHLLAVSI